MPREITKTVYTYAELLERGDKKAIERAKDWLREGATLGNWWEFVYEEWQKALEQIGFENAKINFSGFYSQGDGASFTSNVDLPKLIAFLAKPPKASEVIDGQPEDYRPYVVHKCNGVRSNLKFAHLSKLVENGFIDGAKVVRTRHQYSHERTCTFEMEDLRDTGEWHSGEPGHWESDTPKTRKLYADFGEAAEQLRLDLCKAIYKALDAEYEYLTSDENLVSIADANEYTFTASGAREG